MAAKNQPEIQDQPFGRGWRILAVAIVAVVLAAIIFMAWGLLTH